MLLCAWKRVQLKQSHFNRLGSALLLGLVMLLAACGEGSGNQANTVSCPSVNRLNGGGSTFDNPLFSKLFTEYASIGCHVHVNYQSIGSGAGINDLLQNVVDFGATDAPMSDAQLALSTRGAILHIPATIGAVAISYNLSGISGHVQLTGPIIASIYLGNIKFWDDPQIKALNSAATLPHETITVVHRSDGSGTT